MSEMVSLTVPSHPKFLYVIRSVLYPVALDAGFSRKEARRIVLAVDEAGSNIIKFAYEGDAAGTIAVKVAHDTAKLTIVLTDSGKKPDVAKIAPRKLEEVRPGGLGTHFISAVFDRVNYDTSGASGTVLTLEKSTVIKSGKAV